MKRRQRTHVIPAAKNRWALKKDGVEGDGVFKTKHEAVLAAERGLREGGGEIFVHDRDGRIREAKSIGRGRVGRDVKDPPRRGQLSKSEVRDAVWNGSRALRDDR